jgi:hypothetical protein
LGGPGLRRLVLLAGAVIVAVGVAVLLYTGTLAAA